jgi:hypothetical protein
MAGDINLGGIFDGLFDIGKELITDKDKLVEFNFKTAELKSKMTLALLQQKTHPTVDAIVKVMLALNTFWRPMVGACMTAFGAYAHYKGIDLGGAVNHGIFDGAFLAWGASRHSLKSKGK